MFDKVVFAGGGHRCWWQAGFWDIVTSEIELRPRVIGAVSAGAATACLLYANDSRRALAWYERELAGVRSNVHWLNLLRRGRPLFPHAAIYRKALRALLGGDHFRRLMWHAPEIRVQLARLPEGMGPRQAMLRGMLAYQAEKRMQAPLHPTAGKRIGFISDVRRVQDCRGERELVDLIVASSCTPPFTPMELYDGAPCLDGGLIDNVPCDLVDDVPGTTLVLMTRRYQGMAPVFARGDRVYVQPSQPVAASSWDYTSPKRYQKTYELGRLDGERFLQTFALGRHRDPEHFDGVFLNDAVMMAGQAPWLRPAADPTADGTAAADAVADGVVAAGAAAVGVAAVGADATGATGLTATGMLPAGQGDPAEAPLLATMDRGTGTGTDDRAGSEASADLEPVLEFTAYTTVSPVAAVSVHPTAAGEAEDDQGNPIVTGAEDVLKANQASVSLGQLRSGRSFRASRI